MGNRLETEKIGKLMAKFAIPAIISMLVGSLYNIVDQIFIGQGVGILGNAATNVAFPITTFCVATALLFGVGGASNFNLAAGAGDEEKSHQFMGNALMLLILGGLIIALIVLLFLNPLLDLFGVTEKVLPYAIDYTGITAFGIPFLVVTTGASHLMRADGSPTLSMACTLAGAITNTILDPLFIFGFGWGIKGAAWATVIGQVASGVLVFFYFTKKSNIQFKKKMFRIQKDIAKEIWELGMASFINQIAMAFVQIIMNNTLRHYGAKSDYGAEIPLAVVGIISKVNMVFMAVCIGVSQGCQPIWGFNYGAKNYKRVEETYKRAATICVAVGVAFFLLFQLSPRTVINLFGDGSEIYYRFAERYLRIFMFFTFINAIQPMSAGFFTSMGKAKLGATVSLTRQVLFLLPLIIIFPLIMGIDGVMYAGPIADFSAAVLSIVFVIREIRWMRSQR
ncbi:MATE family efflux transporter [Aequitasia blattaphilus]|uniref:Multidrug export protein MepA n=1 Tax=Aequitasia blattaphilus TaxID=2949332 RepID=A0ABT1E643_9FIRM|nr:MATE family efflux transporter [Aequitasia blattaphilus]MCP1101314.1 MATE family efflux transporter [Aequitasia blattaphilus]MCR8613954.1 MATE family efflux transporter [Aequitasia blattaphilus]